MFWHMSQTFAAFVTKVYGKCRTTLWHMSRNRRIEVLQTINQGSAGDERRFCNRLTALQASLKGCIIILSIIFLIFFYMLILILSLLLPRLMTIK